jgi:ABC-type uncharacterized transport system substrate-binding protein
MRRRCVQSFLLFLVAFVVGGLPASTQQLTGGVPPRVGYVWVGPRGTDGDTLGGLLQGLADFGYFEGRTIVLETRYADGDPGRLPHLFHELAALPVKVLVTPGTPTTRAAREATSIVPIVSVSSDPVGSGFTASLAQPGGNITGLSLVTGEGLAGKWLELLKEAVPRFTQVAVLWNPDNQASARQVFKLQEMAPLFGLKVIPVAARRADELDAAFATMRADGQAGGLIVTDDPFLSSVQEHLVAGAAARKLPAL